MTNWTGLKRLAESIWSKDWHQGADRLQIEAGDGVIVCKVSGSSKNEEAMKDAEFIAAANPKTILALIAENEALRAANMDSVDWVNSAKADIERLEADNRSKNGSMKAFGEQIAKLQRSVKNREKQLDKRSAEVEALRKDAERYRWLRAHHGLSLKGHDFISYGEVADFRIDNAMTVVKADG